MWEYARQDFDAFTVFKKTVKGVNAEHYSDVDHGERGRRREREQHREQQQQSLSSQGGKETGHADRSGEETARDSHGERVREPAVKSPTRSLRFS